MNDRYNGNIYLKTSDLNDIENRIESLTNEIQEKIFNNQSSPLRTIQVGDNLNNKTAYFLFPKNVYESISGSGTIFIKINNDTYFTFYKTESAGRDSYRILFRYNGTNYVCYNKVDGNYYTLVSNKRKFSSDIGSVVEIDNNNDIYPCIKIYDNEYIIPNYIRHTWIDNEFLTMQKIQNIENGIANIGDYYYKPNGWLSPRKWLNSLGTNIQNISYQDLNRWVNNLKLINFDNLEHLTIWNTELTQLTWDVVSEVEWEDL